LRQRIDAEGVFDLKNGKLAIGAVRLNNEFLISFENAGTYAVIIEAGSFKIPSTVAALAYCVACLC
jgi:hypothetical protein